MRTILTTLILVAALGTAGIVWYMITDYQRSRGVVSVEDRTSVSAPATVSMPILPAEDEDKESKSDSTDNTQDSGADATKAEKGVEEAGDQPTTAKTDATLSVDDAAILAVQRTTARERCFGAGASFYESLPHERHVHENVTDGNVFVDNQVLITFVKDATDDEVMTYAEEVGGTIVGCVASLRLFQVQFVQVLPQSTAARTQFLDAIMAHPFVDVARLNIRDEAQDEE